MMILAMIKITSMVVVSHNNAVNKEDSNLQSALFRFNASFPK